MNVRIISRIVPWLVACILAASCGFVSAQGLLAGGLLPSEAAGEEDSAAETNLLLKHLPSTMLQPAFQKPSSLLWRNGETIDGEFQGATGEQLIWKTALFSEALEVKNEVIERIDFKTPSYRIPEATFRVIMLDGSHLTGELTHLEDGNLTLASSSAGDLTIKLDQIVKIECLTGAGIAIPHAQALLTRNTNTGSNRQSPDLWMLTAAGHLASPAFNQALETRHELPPAGALSFGFTTGQEIHFSLQLTIDGMGQVVLETWGDELVFRSGSSFSTVRTFSDDERSFACQLCWNAPENRLELYSEGDKLVEMTTDGPASSESSASQPDSPGRQFLNAFSGLIPGNRRPRRAQSSTLRLHNKGAGMVIDHFKITEWPGGAPPMPPSADGAYVETSTGIITGSLTRISDGQAHIQNEDNNAVSMDTVRAVYWPRQAALERDPALTELWYADGQLIRGTLLDSETLTLRTAFSEDPLVVSQEGLRALILPDAEDADAEQPSLDDLDVLTMGNGSLHGLAKFQGDNLPVFFPVGSVYPVRLADSGDWNLARMSNKTAPEASTGALAHLTSNESVPVTLLEMDRHQLAFTSDIFENSTLDVGYLHAVQFGVSEMGPMGFDGPGWRSLGGRSGQLKRDANGIDLPAHAAIGNAYACQGKDLRFTLNRKSGNGSIRVRLFTQGSDPKSGGISYLIAHYGSIYCGLEHERQDGQMQNQTEVEVGQDPPVIRFRVKDDTVQLFVNDVPCAEANFQGERKGNGMIIESTSVWGNSVGTVRLSGFSAQASGGLAGAVSFTEEAKDQALLLPRLRRNPPPGHLLIGRNGDLLRGEIEAMTSSHFAFRTGLESFNVPRDRLAAIVWLKPPSDGEDAQKTASSPKAGKADEDAGSSRQWLDLVTGGRLALDVEAWHAEEVVGTHALLGECRIPIDLVHRVSLQEPPPSYALASLSDWRLEHTKDPVLPEDEGTSSPMIGKLAPAFTLTTLEGDPVSLEKMKGKVVVLDFWATWCGPCVQSLPGLIETMSAFPQEKVAFLTVNQGEGQARIDQFLQARGLDMPVALDGDQSVGRKYGVESIPNTVIIDHEGTIIFVKIGLSPNGDTQIADTVREAIESIEG